MRRRERAALRQVDPVQQPEAAHVEFSKQVVIRCEWIVALHVVVTLLVIAFQPEIAQAAVALMQAVVPLYISVFVGYYGKAGFENYQKIRSAVHSDEYGGQG